MYEMYVNFICMYYVVFISTPLYIVMISILFQPSALTFSHY